MTTLSTETTQFTLRDGTARAWTRSESSWFFRPTSGRTTGRSICLPTVCG